MSATAVGRHAADGAPVAAGEAGAPPPIRDVDGPPRAAREAGAHATRRQIRGSSLLLVGRFLGKGVNFAVQVLVVGHLSKSAYGAFTYALSYVDLGEAIATLGLDRGVTRFAPIYHERRDWGRFFGLVLMVVATVLGLGLSLAVTFRAFDQRLAGAFIDDPDAILLLGILVFLVPVQAFDTLLTGLFAVFASPRAIFFRKHVLAPLLKLAVVGVMIATGGGAAFLAVGYLAAGLVGVAVYAVSLVYLLRSTGVLDHFDRHALQIPAREVLAFTLPLLSSELVFVVTHWLDVVLVGHFHGTQQVAALRAVQPAAKLNTLVLASFGLLYTPAAARMFARGERTRINQLYWRNAAWTAVMTFPVFAVTFALARPLTLTLYGERYADSAVILALLSFGYYFSAALGQNGLTLKVYGRVRYVVVNNLLAVAASVTLNLLLIPRYGALGAAIGACATMVAFNLLKQAGLRLGTGIDVFDRRFLRVYASIVVAASLLVAAQTARPDLPAALLFALAALAALAVIRVNRAVLAVEDTFPEMLKLPGARRLFGVPAARRGGDGPSGDAG